MQKKRTRKKKKKKKKKKTQEHQLGQMTPKKTAGHLGSIQIQIQLLGVSSGEPGWWYWLQELNQEILALHGLPSRSHRVALLQIESQKQQQQGKKGKKGKQV